MEGNDNVTATNEATTAVTGSETVAAENTAAVTGDVVAADKVETLAEAEAAEEAKHPAHSVLDQMENELNALGSYAVSKIKHLIDEVRAQL